MYASVRVWGLYVCHIVPVEVRASASRLCSQDLPTWQMPLPTEYHTGHTSGFSDTETLNLTVVQK